MSVRAKLLLGMIVLVSVTVYVAYLGASSSWQYYVTADECAANIQQFTGRQLRISGRVARGSLQVGADRSSATFVLEGVSGGLTTFCRGPLPDNLAEEISVVVEGTLDDRGSVHAERVLTRCASKYEAQH
jgi:cytochrome c-type biogenesis protein CcmE